MITTSIINHLHGAQVLRLVEGLLALPEVARVIVTNNVSQDLAWPLALRRDTRLMVLDNAAPKGFGANHNAAFAYCQEAFFCVVNPDILLQDNPFPSLLAALGENGIAGNGGGGGGAKEQGIVQLGLAAPRVVNERGVVEDSWRVFLSPLELFTRQVLKRRKAAALQRADWAAGMFLLFPARAYRDIKGFDERYFMYCEDMDMCARLRKRGYGIAFVEEARVIHPAQRDSHRKWRFLAWHITSLLRFWWIWRGGLALPRC